MTKFLKLIQKTKAVFIYQGKMIILIQKLILNCKIIKKIQKMIYSKKQVKVLKIKKKKQV